MRTREGMAVAKAKGKASRQNNPSSAQSSRPNCTGGTAPASTAINDLAELFSIGRATVYRTLQRNGAGDTFLTGSPSRCIAQLRVRSSDSGLPVQTSACGAHVIYRFRASVALRDIVAGLDVSRDQVERVMRQCPWFEPWLNACWTVPTGRLGAG